MAQYGLDEYSLKARLFPAFLVLLPLGIFLGQFADTRSAIIGACSGLGGSALFSYVLAEWSRDVGKRREQELWRRWGGPPTTVYLRHRTTPANAPLQERRKAVLQKLAPDVVLPTVGTEAEDPAYADACYEVATKVLIGKTRQRDRYEILFQENVSYGFRRNLWALKPFGAVSCAITIVAGFLMMFAALRITYNFIAVGLATAILLTWLTIVESSWVRRAGEVYAERLFACLDEMDS